MHKGNDKNLPEYLAGIRTLTFDCYGTLVDWKGGLSTVFVEIFGDRARARLDELFEAYVSLEAELEAGAFQRYRDILGAVSDQLANVMGVTLDAAGRSSLASMLPRWPVFADTNPALRLLKKRFRLGVLSNIDRDLFAATSKSFSVSFDFLVTAEDVESYKPAHGHFRQMLSRHGESGSTLHVAQSLFHDGAPANELGIPFVWINRYGQSNDAGVPMMAEFPNLISLAEAIGPG